MSPPWLFDGARSILNLFRAIDTLVYALIFVAAVGLGSFPGVLAVVAYTATVLAKLYSEAIEAIDLGPVEAVAATGKAVSSCSGGGSCPSSSRSSCPSPCTASRPISGRQRILGFVGAGGIGFYIQTYLRMLNYPAASTMLLVLIVLVMVVDFASSRLRARLV